MTSWHEALWLVALIVILGLLGVAIIVAILAAWRNYNHRQDLLSHGRRLRHSQRKDKNEPPDAWREAGRRMKTPEEEEEKDE